jgi:hypothetical protein
MSSTLPKVADELAVDIAAVPMLVLQVSKNISFFVFSFSTFTKTNWIYDKIIRL